MPLSKPKLPILIRGHPLARGLIGAWLFYEGTGSVIRNAVTGLGNGTVVGNPVWVAGGMKFDGAGDYISLGTNANFRLTTAVSMFVSFTILDRAGGGDPACIMGRGEEDYRLYWHGGDSYKFKFDLGLWKTDWSQVVSTTVATNNTSYTIAATWDGAGGNRPQRIYINGKVEGETIRAQATTSSQADDVLAIATQGDQTARTINAIVHAALLYERELAASEVCQLHADPYQLFRPRRFFVPATISQAYQLTADAGTVSLTGQDASLLADRLLTAEAGSVTLSGQDAALLAGRLLTAAAGSLSLSGQDVTLLVSRLLTAEAGSITLSGQDASLLRNALLTAEAGALTFSGQDAGLSIARRLVAEAGTLILSGQDAGLLAARLLTAASGSLSLSGQNATLLVSRLLEAASGALSLSGLDATLTYTPIGGPTYTLTAEAGTISLSGQDVGLVLARVLSAETGSLSLAGQAVTLVYSGAASPTPASRVFVIAAEDRIYIVLAENRIYSIQA